MNWKEHIGIGAGVSLVLLLILLIGFKISIGQLILPLFIGMIYSILPDIDHPISKITWSFLTITTIGFSLVYFLGMTKIFVYVLLLQIATVYCANHLPHRGIVHRYATGLVLSLLLFNLGWLAVLFGFFGYASHLVADKEWKFI